MADKLLGSLYAHFLARTNALVEQFLLPAPQGSTHRIFQHQQVFQSSRAFSTIRLLHLWGEFTRVVVVRSALGGCYTVSGAHVNAAPGVTSVRDILVVIKQPQLSGPRLYWDTPEWTSKQVSQLRIQNGAQVTLGLGAAPVDDLRRVRNFLTHPNSHTKSEYEGLTRRKSLVGANPDDLLRSRTPGGATLLESWVIDFQTAALNTIR